MEWYRRSIFLFDKCWTRWLLPSHCVSIQVEVTVAIPYRATPDTYTIRWCIVNFLCWTFQRFLLFALQNQKTWGSLHPISPLVVTLNRADLHCSVSNSHLIVTDCWSEFSRVSQVVGLESDILKNMCTFMWSLRRPSGGHSGLWWFTEINSILEPG